MGLALHTDTETGFTGSGPQISDPCGLAVYNHVRSGSTLQLACVEEAVCEDQHWIRIPGPVRSAPIFQMTAGVKILSLPHFWVFLSHWLQRSKSDLGKKALVHNVFTLCRLFKIVYNLCSSPNPYNPHPRPGLAATSTALPSTLLPADFH